MKYSEALKKIQDAGLMDEVEAITTKMEDVVSSRNEIKGKVSNLEKQLQSLSTLTEALGLSAEDDGKQWSEKVTKMGEAIAKLKTENTGLSEQLVTKDQSVEELQKKLSAQEKKVKVFSVANLAKANPRVLELMAQEVDFEIKEGKVMVKVGEGEEMKTQELEEFVAASPEWSPLMNSLYSEEKQRIPDGGSGYSAKSSVTQQSLKAIANRYALPE